jgi:hypothetical protein
MRPSMRRQSNPICETRAIPPGFPLRGHGRHGAMNPAGRVRGSPTRLARAPPYLGESHVRTDDANCSRPAS